MPVLICHKTRFYSELDEDAFFGALKRIKGVKRVEGRGWDIRITVPSRISEASLRQLFGLFRRYQVDTSQLAPIANARNRSWLRRMKGYRVNRYPGGGSGGKKN